MTIFSAEMKLRNAKRILRDSGFHGTDAKITEKAFCIIIDEMQDKIDDLVRHKNRSECG